MNGYSYITICSDSQTNCCNIERVSDEVHNIPKVTCILLEPHVPELLDLAPDEARHPGQDAIFHSRGKGASLGCICWKVPAHYIFNPLGGQNE